MLDRLLTLGVAALLLGIPWHEFLVQAWKPLGAWDEAVLLGLAGLLALWARRGGGWRPCGFLAPVLALAGTAALSALAHGGSLWPLRAWLPYTVAGLAACQVDDREARQMVRCLLVIGGVAAAYGLVTFLAFRSLGGGLGVRPPLDGMPLALVYPYYCGAVPRSGHLVGPFMNDLYFGVWLAALAGLLFGRAPAEGWRPGTLLLGTLLVLGVAWTYSRSGWLALAVSLGWLALRGQPRLLLALGLVVLTALPFLSWQDRMRFLQPNSPVTGAPGRVAMAFQALDTLAHGPFLGTGPGSVRLADFQYAKVVVETGWPGALALGWLLWTLAAPAWRARDPEALGLSAAVLALLVAGVSGELFEVPQVALTLWILAGLRRGGESAPSNFQPHRGRGPSPLAE